jgi:hypothetical protein
MNAHLHPATEIKLILINCGCRYSAYCREYTGYMALHVADTAQPGTAWRFNAQLRST